MPARMRHKDKNVRLFSTAFTARNCLRQFLAFLLSKATKETKNAFCGCGCVYDPHAACGLNKK
jgi:hypothetical protein